MRRSLNPLAMGWGFIFTLLVCAVISWVGFVIYVAWHFISKFW